MGEVFRARDTKLNRDVAIKILPEAFAHDTDRLARFQREAKTLASLNHPNIAAIYGLEESGGLTALVMELVEGDDLSQRIARGAIAIDEALPIAKQIAEALEAAHEQGIVHRDLKPANLKVRPDGTVKVLDFGLAKAMEAPAAMSPSVSRAPTITSPAMMTGAGMILGTAAYMSPEQARGKPVDKRADIWAFGCVLYEMLTGKRAFPGEDVADTLANVLKREPDWEALPSDVPPSVRTLLHRCLIKDRRNRIADIAVALFVLDHHASLAVPRGTAVATPSRRPLWQRIVIPTAAALLTSAVVGSGVWFATRPAEPTQPRVSRLTITPTLATALTISNNQRDLAITPDGSRVVYVGNGGTQLFVRALDVLEPVVAFTGVPRGPFVSADGRWIGFTDGTTVLKKVAVAGGPAVTLATVDGVPRGATWGADDAIIFATGNRVTGLQRVPAAGGPTTVLTQADRAQGEADHMWPELLPGGRAVVFTITAVAGGLDVAQLAVLDLQTGMRTILVRGGTNAHYVPGGVSSPIGVEREGGHLVYAAAGTLRAIAFDLATLQTRGAPVPVVPDVMTNLNGGVYAVMANDGTLAYVSQKGTPGAGAQRRLVWVDRQGRETQVQVPMRAYAFPRLSPDGRSIAVFANDQENDIWLSDLVRPALTRLTFDPGAETYPLWTSDGGRVVFTSEREGVRNLFWQAANGSGAVERLTESPNQQTPTAVSPDGRRLIFTELSPKTAYDVMQVELDETRRVTPLVQSSFVERNGVVSPDGRWLAYESNQSGPFEIYVRPFPDVNGGQWLVSTLGGTRPLWAPSGEELFYASPTGALMRVGVERSPSWTVTTPETVIKEGYSTISDVEIGRSYDISRDGQRFLMIKEGGSTDQAIAPTSLIVVQNWLHELKRLVPTN